MAAGGGGLRKHAERPGEGGWQAGFPRNGAGSAPMTLLVGEHPSSKAQAYEVRGCISALSLAVGSFK